MLGLKFELESSKTELIPADGHKSFYGKAVVFNHVSGLKVLKSYNTYVAAIMPDGTFVKLWDGWSATTGRHLSAFSSQYQGKKAWCDMPTTKLS